MRKNNTTRIFFIFSIITFLLSQPVMAAKFKCWRNNEGVKECGTYVPPEYSQKRIETRGKSGRVIEVEERAKTKAELDEIARLEELKKIEDAKVAEQKKKDSILLNTFTRERDITMLRDSKINVLEGIITVTKSNNKTLGKKLNKYHKRAANIERNGKTPPETLLGDIKKTENSITKNKKSIKTKHAEQEGIRLEYEAYIQRFRILKNTTTKDNKKDNKTVKTKP